MHSPAWLSVVSALFTAWFLVLPTASFCRLQITCSLPVLSALWGWALPSHSLPFLFLLSNLPGLQMPAAHRRLLSLCSHLPHPPHSSALPNKSTLSKCFTLWLKLLQFLCDILSVLVNRDAQSNHKQRYDLPSAHLSSFFITEKQSSTYWKKVSFRFTLVIPMSPLGCS